MQKYLLVLTLFAVGAVATASAQSLRNNNAPIEGAAVQIDVGGDGYYDDGDCEDCYDYGYYNDGVVWVGPGWYYGNYFYDEPAFWGWRRNYYWRGHGHGWRHHGGHGGGHWHGGGGHWHGGGGHHGGGGGHHGGGGGHHGGGHHR